MVGLNEDRVVTCLSLDFQVSMVTVRWWTWRKKLSDDDFLPCRSCEAQSAPGWLLPLTTSGSEPSYGP